MKKKDVLLSAAACLLVLCTSISNAWAYFTTYSSAAGSITIHMGDETEIEESISDWTKHVVITSTEDSGPVYIRAKAFSGVNIL